MAQQSVIEFAWYIYLFIFGLVLFIIFTIYLIIYSFLYKIPSVLLHTLSMYTKVCDELIDCYFSDSSLIRTL